MAALPKPATAEVVPLKRLKGEELEPVLAEEQLTWRSVLRWDFGPSVDLVRRFLRISSLSGYALRVDTQIVGYVYYVSEDRKALIGDLFLMKEFASTENEDHLLSAVLYDLMSSPFLQRIEAQLLLMHGPFERQLPLSAYVRVFPRIFMVANLQDAEDVAEVRGVDSGVRILPWNPARQEEVAMLIAAAYHDHVDSSINDQYRSYAGAKRFLSNIVHYPGCGSFFDSGSYIAEGPGGKMAGVILSSFVASDAGHITQVCVAPEWQGKGIGLELMRRALLTIGQHSGQWVSLTVTASNAGAIQLYQKLGFRATRRFAAYVWEGF